MKAIPNPYDATLVEGQDPVTGLDGIIIESRGGTSHSNNYRNPEHSKLLAFVLARLEANKLSSMRFYVAAKSRIYADNNERLLTINGKYEIDFPHNNIYDFEKELKKAIKESGQKTGVKGGNSTKRLLITSATKTINWAILLFGEATKVNGIPPNDLEFAYQLIKKRLHQAAFRQDLLTAYKCTCSVTSCKVQAVLDAAHIIPYSGPSSSTLNNGLLLRSDIHDLFDLGLIKITSAFKIRVDEKLNDSEYWQYDGLRINLPDDEKDFPVFQQVSE